MPKIHQYESNAAGESQCWFYCPGCRCTHAFTVGSSRGWTWNGSLEKPTFAPSLLCNGSFPESRCHSFVTEGKILFLDDCYHELKGQTVEIPEWEGLWK